MPSYWKKKEKMYKHQRANKGVKRNFCNAVHGQTQELSLQHLIFVG